VLQCVLQCVTVCVACVACVTVCVAVCVACVAGGTCEFVLQRVAVCVVGCAAGSHSPMCRIHAPPSCLKDAVLQCVACVTLPIRLVRN